MSKLARLSVFYFVVGILSIAAIVAVESAAQRSPKLATTGCTNPVVYDVSPLCAHITATADTVQFDYKTDPYVVVCFAYDDGTSEAVPINRVGKRVCQTVAEWTAMPRRLAQAQSALERGR